MMNKRRTRAIGRTKYLMFLPLAALLMIVSNIEAVARATQKITAEVMEAVTPAETPEVQPQPENIAPLPKQEPDNIAPSSQPEMNVAPIPQQEKSKKVTYKGKIVDDEAGNPISDVKIIVDHKYQSISKSTVNAQGEFRIETSPEASILFEHTKSDGSKLVRFCTPKVLAQMNPDNMVIELIPYIDIKTAATEADVYEVVENMPEFPNGGMTALMKYLSDNIRYPEAAHKAGIQGRVTVQFVVGKDGSIGNVSILRGVNADLDAEAIRVISSMPKWKPGTQKGEPVKVKYTVPVMFRLAPEPVEKIDETTVVGYHTPVAGEVYDVVDKMPEFPGGMTGLMQYLSKNIRYPAEAQTKGIQGRVTVAVIINTEGKAVNASIVRSVDPSLDAEALRVAGTMPDWVPGTKDGKPVNVKYTFPVTFRLQ